MKFGVLGGVLTLVLGYSGIGYFTGAVPFPIEPRGDITAGSLCGAMGSRGDRERIAEELQNTLPTSREYSSSGLHHRSKGRWHRDFCFIDGDGERLFYAGAELGNVSGGAWHDDSYDGPDGKSERFQAGRSAEMTQRGAVILVPCTPPSGWDLDYIEVTVYMHQLLVGSADENRHAILAIALSAARSAHERAECPLPSKLPRNVPERG